MRTVYVSDQDEGRPHHSRRHAELAGIRRNDHLFFSKSTQYKPLLRREHKHAYKWDFFHFFSCQGGKLVQVINYLGLYNICCDQYFLSRVNIALMGKSVHAADYR